MEKKPPATEILNFVCAKMLIFVSTKMFNKANYITTHEQLPTPFINKNRCHGNCPAAPVKTYVELFSVNLS